MFEFAVQPRAESLDSVDAGRPPAADIEAIDVGGHKPAGRRYGADDFRALAVRLMAGSGGPRARSASVSSITLPDFLAVFRAPESHDEPGAEHDGAPLSDGEPAIAIGHEDGMVSAMDVADADPVGPAPDTTDDGTTEEDEAPEWRQSAPASETLDVETAPAAEPDLEPAQTAAPGDMAEPEEPGSASMETGLAAAETEADASPSAGDDDQPGLQAQAAAEIEQAESGIAEPPRDDAGDDAGLEGIETAPALADTAARESTDTAATDHDDPRPEHPALTPEPAPDERSDSAAEPVAAQPVSASVPALRDAFEPDRQSGDTARMLLDIMARPSGAVQPQERALAGDTLLRLVSRMPVDSIVALCERLCIMEAPPPLLVRRLVQHPNAEVAGPLLERCTAISDQDLMTLIATADAVRLRLIARRRHLSPALTDALIELGDSSVLLTVVRNPGAALSPEAFGILAERAKSHHALQAPLATRADTPAPIAFELFWSLPPELRRYVLSRFLTESATLDRILKIAHTLDDAGGPDGNVPSRTADRAQIDGLVASMAEGQITEAAQSLAAIAGICQANAERIISDPAGEPLTIAMKALGLSRTQFAAAAETLNDAPAAPLQAHRRIGELKALFDSLSFTKARVLLTYWDWAAEQSGPYSGESE